MTLRETPTIKEFFAEFSDRLNTRFGRPAEQEPIRNGPLIVRRLDSLARLIVKGDTANCAAVALVGDKWYTTANDAESIAGNVGRILHAVKKIELINGVVRTKKARKYLLSDYLGPVQAPSTLKRLEKDVRKFLSALKTDIFGASAIKRLKDAKIIQNPRNLHAEILLLRYLNPIYASGNDTTITLGISKLCCRLCAAGIYAIKKTYNNVTIQVRGRHGNFYYAWIPSRLLFINNLTCFENFVGKKAFNIYSRASSRSQEHIISYLKRLDDNRGFLNAFFRPQRGGVNLNSDSLVPSDTESEESSYTSDASDSSSEASSEATDESND